MKGLAKDWGWLKSNIVTVLGAVIAVLGAGVFWGYHNRKTRDLSTQIAIKDAHRKVAGFDALRAKLEGESRSNVGAIQGVERARKRVQRQALELEQEIGEMDDDEIEAGFRELY